VTTRSSLSVDPDARATATRDDRTMTTQTFHNRTGPTVADAMSSAVIHCTPETPLRNVARLMSAHRIHAVYVFDYDAEDDDLTQLWGLVTDLDVVAAWSVVDERTAGNSAVTPLVTISTDEPIGRGAQLMAESGSGHLAVLDHSTRRPVGVLSTLDVARVIGAAAGPGDAA